MATYEHIGHQLKKLLTIGHQVVAMLDVSQSVMTAVRLLTWLAVFFAKYTYIISSSHLSVPVDEKSETFYQTGDGRDQATQSRHRIPALSDLGISMAAAARRGLLDPLHPVLARPNTVPGDAVRVPLQDTVYRVSACSSRPPPWTSRCGSCLSRHVPHSAPV